MHTINLLIGNNDRRISNLVEALVLDICYERVAVDTYRTAQLIDFARRAASGRYDLAILAPGHLDRDSALKSEVTTEGVISAMTDVKKRADIPLVAINTSGEIVEPLLEVGLDAVLTAPFDADALRFELRRILRIPERVAPSLEPKHISFFGALFPSLRPRRA